MKREKNLSLIRLQQNNGRATILFIWSVMQDLTDLKICFH